MCSVGMIFIYERVSLLFLANQPPPHTETTIIILIIVVPTGTATTGWEEYLTEELKPGNVSTCGNLP